MKCLDKIPKGTTLVTADVIGLFTNILHDLGWQSLGKMLNETCICEVPTEEIISIAQFFLKNNYFEINEKVWN